MFCKKGSRVLHKMASCSVKRGSCSVKRVLVFCKKDKCDFFTKQMRFFLQNKWENSAEQTHFFTEQIPFFYRTNVNV